MELADRRIDRIIRVATVPSIITGLTVLLLYMPAHVLGIREFIMLEVCLLLIPSLAYPASELIKKSADRRSRQRNAAMVFSAAGYLIGFIWMLLNPCCHVTKVLLLSYVLSIAALLILNKGLHFKASGHSCALTAPTALLTWQLSPLAVIPCALLIGAAYASSIKLGRHSLAQLLAGSAVSVAAVLLSMMIL
ncbi:MAG: hypothetical protein IJG63_06265 [Oscillospiraceae bacterium]|nr:hypothetical protein [Oscillospiraceae bacterium]